MANIFIDKGNTVVQLEKGKDKEELKLQSSTKTSKRYESIHLS